LFESRFGLLNRAIHLEFTDWLKGYQQMRTTSKFLAATLVAFLLPRFAAAIPQSGKDNAVDPTATEVREVEAGRETGEDGFVPLFNGENLEGWKNPYAWGVAEVVDGEIRLTADRKFFLVTEATYSDFVLEAEIRLPEKGVSNSGIMFRCHVEPDKVFGYQAECDPKERAWTGGLYDEGRRGWLFPKAGQEKEIHLVRAPLGEWIRYRIECQGDHFRIFINDELVTDQHDDVDASGHIGIQHHGEKGQTYSFRNIRLKDLSDPEKISEEKSSESGSSKKTPPEKDGADESGDQKNGGGYQ
jgi:hypothetical protein